MCFAYWVTEARDAHSQYVIITAFPQQQWLHERASMLRYTYSTLPLRLMIVDLKCFDKSP